MVGFFSSGIIHFNRVFHINHPFYPFWGTSILYTPQLPGGFKYLIFSPRKLGKISNFTHTFQMGWNHQLVLYTPPRLTAWTWSHDGLVQMILRNPFGGPYSQVPAVNLLGCIFNSVQTKIPSQTAWTHTRAKMMGYQLDDSILLHKKIGVKHQTSSWYCWWFRKPKQPPMGCFWNPANNGDLTIWTGDRRISSINSIRLFRVPEWHAFVCFNCVSRPRWWNHVWIQRIRQKCLGIKLMLQRLKTRPNREEKQRFSRGHAITHVAGIKQAANVAGNFERCLYNSIFFEYFLGW